MVRPKRLRFGATLEKLSEEERKSLTHGHFWIPGDQRTVYRLALETLNAGGIPYVVAGAYAIYEHTGIYRQTKDLDLLFEPKDVLPAAHALRDAGFELKLEQAHWLAKALKDDIMIDLIYGMGNGVAFIDRSWYEHGREGVLAGTPVKISPVEELLWHRLFIHERHRQDMADILHLILTQGDVMDWDRVVKRVGPHWSLLLAQLQLFHYVYPGFRSRVPREVMEGLLDRARAEIGQDDPDEALTNGPLISRFSFAIDVQEWGFHDTRVERIRRALNSEPVRQITRDSVWTTSEPADSEETRALESTGSS
jgi:hypothetical protein